MLVIIKSENNWSFPINCRRRAKCTYAKSWRQSEMRSFS